MYIVIHVYHKIKPHNWNIVESGVKHHAINLNPQLTAPLTHI